MLGNQGVTCSEAPCGSQASLPSSLVFLLVKCDDAGGELDDALAEFEWSEHLDIGAEAEHTSACRLERLEGERQSDPAPGTGGRGLTDEGGDALAKDEGQFGDDIGGEAQGGAVAQPG